MFGINQIEETSSDISINWGENLSEEYKSKKPYEIGDRYSYFYKKDVALYEVFEGSTIKVRPYLKADINLIAEFLLNFPMALCLSQRNKIVLHASSVNINNTAVLFSGPSHSGKSTLAIAFSKSIATLLSEDISVLSFDENNQLILQPSQPYIKLSKEAATWAGLDFNGGLSFKNRERRGFQIKEFSEQIGLAKFCFFLNSSQNRLIIEHLSSREAIQNIYKYSYLSNTKKDNTKVLGLLKSLKFFSLGIPKNFGLLEQSCEDIVNFIKLENNKFKG